MDTRGVAAIALAILLSACRTAPIQDVVGAPLQPHPGLENEAVDEAIWRAGRKLGWQVERLAPADLRATLRLRKHVAIVAIRHDGHRFSITHAGGENLLREGDQIHARYNEWVRRLSEQIQAEPIVPVGP